jgi:deoxyribonuclease-1
MKILFLILSIFSLSVFAQNTTIDSFSKSKRNLKKIYNKTSLIQKTIYCGCSFTKGKIDKKSCGYQGKIMTKGKNKGKEKFAKRSNRVEWEHVFPISEAIAAYKECRLPNGKKLSRKKCEKKSKEYRLALSDMYNLYPSVGSLNASRSNYSFVEDEITKKEWGSCEFQVSNRKVSISNKAKGIVARTYKYMDLVYPFKAISNKNKKIFDAWDKMYPVTKEECKRYKLIKQIQGNENPVLAKVCK